MASAYIHDLSTMFDDTHSESDVEVIVGNPTTTSSSSSEKNNSDTTFSDEYSSSKGTLETTTKLDDDDYSGFYIPTRTSWWSRRLFLLLFWSNDDNEGQYHVNIDNDHHPQSKARRHHNTKKYYENKKNKTTTTTTTTRPTFLDYLSGGLELQLSVAIDFTGSNGDPRQPGTLHYIDRYRRQLNDYEKALTAVGSIVAKYDHDQQFPVMGFGAKYNGQIQHCFQLGGHNKEVHGVQGMLEAYRSTFATGLTMSGPTVFSQVIDVAASQARRDQQQQQQQQLQQQQQQQRYHILLILTDGAVSDVMRTKQAIAEASTAPLSIVIVGIGQADFGTMQFLDDFADSNNNGIRDICQFVEFRKFAHNKSGLTEATLEEIPDQVVDYFQSNNIPPLPPPPPVSQLLVPEPDDWNDDDEEEEDDEIIPLDLNFHEDGEITLGSGGVYDDTDYNNTMYAGITPMVPPSAPNPTAPIAPTVPYAPPPQQQQQQPYSIPAQPPPQQQQQQRKWRLEPPQQQP
mmetsp:Transcript_3460/g.5331  ORF Transcript_3460/g.5331 Transcript_3460/m.5331 type:complete len:513 (+) Transcript_3460:86-1624(+)